MRKLGLVSSLWAALLFLPLTVLALGLGEIEVDSYLNQPLKAEIEVISARPGEIDDLLVGLASRDAFRKAGLERPAVLSKLKFKVDKAEDGQSATISISTKTPVKEPFLSFLVEADWAKGRLLREFTVLLDPPSFAQQAVITTSEPQAVTQSAPAASAESTPIADSASTSMPMESVQQVSRPIATSEPADYTSQPASAPMEQTSPLASQASPDQIVVAKGDTLWGIASQFKDDEHSMAQVMLALQMMNPEAFGQDNINNLKVGAVLRVPELNTLDSLNKQEAYAQVLEQNGLWDEYVARKSGVASTASPTSASAGVSSAQTDEESQLSLLTPGEGDSENASLQNDANGDDAGKIRKQLALAEEELEAARLENEDLSSRVKSLEEQLSKFEELQKMVQIQDDSLAQLQNTTAEQATVEAEPPAQPEMMGTEAAVIDEALVDETAASEQVSDEEAPSEVMVEAADELMAEQESQTAEMDAQTDLMAAQQEMTDEAMASTEAETVLPTTTEEVAEDTEQTVIVPAPAIITETPDGGFMDMIPSIDELLNDPVMLGGLGGVLALILGFILLRKKKSDKDSDGAITIEEPEGTHLDDDATPIHVPGAEEDTAQRAAEAVEDETDIETSILDTEQHMAETLVTEEVEEEEDEFAKTAVVSADELAQTEEVESLPQEQDDVLNEVDVYLAYGLYDNAEDLLKQSLDNSPERADYRAKLLDTYFATKNKEAFIKEAEMLKSLGGAADRFWDRVQVMGFELAPENDLFSGAKDSSVSVDELEFAKPETPDFDISADDEATDFSSTDFNIGDETMDVSATQVLDAENDFTSTQNIDESLEDLDVEFPDLDDVSGNDESEKKDDEFSAEDLMLDESDAGSDVDLDFAADLDLSVDEQDAKLAESDEIEEEVSLEIDEDEINFDLPEEAADTDENQEIIDLEPTVEAPPALDKVPQMEDEDEVEIDLAVDEPELEDETTGDRQQADDSLTSETLVVAPGEVETDVDQNTSNEVELALDEGLDFDMSDMDDDELKDGEFSPSETVALGEINISDDDITEFRPAEMTGEFDAFQAEAADNDEAVLNEVDAVSGLDKTGTFAPGDFNEEEAAQQADDVSQLQDESQAEDIEDLTDIDDIEDLMLPDDVDEVATKLDLAKAFIDMGDAEGARSSLEEVMSEGTEEQKAEATGLLEQIK